MTIMKDSGMLVISGGQTGVDLAGLRAAQVMGFRTGGTAPFKWRTQAGPQPSLLFFFLRESTVSNYVDRTKENVVNADATLLIYVHGDSAGTKLTRKLCKSHDRPTLEVDLKQDVNADSIIKWIKTQAAISTTLYGSFTLNIAGNSSSSAPGIFQTSFSLLVKVFKELASGPTDQDDADRAQLFAQVSNPQMAAQLNDRFDHIPQLDFRNRYNGLIIDGAAHVSS